MRDNLRPFRKKPERWFIGDLWRNCFFSSIPYGMSTARGRRATAWQKKSAKQRRARYSMGFFLSFFLQSNCDARLFSHSARRLNKYSCRTHSLPSLLSALTIIRVSFWLAIRRCVFLHWLYLRRSKLNTAFIDNAGTLASKTDRCLTLQWNNSRMSQHSLMTCTVYSRNCLAQQASL